MKFSVLMSVYEGGDSDHLDAAIESLVLQTLQPDEIVIVKDGPLTDKLDAVIDKFNKQYGIFKIVVLEKNVGLGKALNRGMEKCSYELIARMDADDISVHDRFEKQINYFDEFPESVIVGANITEYDEDMQFMISNREVPETAKEIISYSKLRSPFNHVTVVLRKSAVQQAGGYQDCPYFEDYHLWLRMLQLSDQIHNIQEPLVNVRGGSSMIDRRGGFRYAKDCYFFLLKAYNLDAISKLDFVKNTCIRVPVSIAPSRLRNIIYKTTLRKKRC